MNMNPAHAAIKGISRIRMLTWFWPRYGNDRNLVGSSAMAGAVGGGGLGDMGIRYGYQRFMPDVMAAVVVILIIFVQSLQSFGDWAVRRVSHK